MKKFFLSIVLALLSMTAHAEIWYYIQSGCNLENYNGPVILVIRDNDGYLWTMYQGRESIQNNLLQNQNYYIDLFNNGILNGYHDKNGMPVASRKGDPFSPPGSPYCLICRDFYSFSRLDVEKKTSKCYVLYDAFLCNGDPTRTKRRNALSLDFETLIHDCQNANPVYYTSVPQERFIVRKSVDDLF